MHGPAESLISRALAMMPGGTYIITASFEGKKAGATVRSAMPCSYDPLLVCAASRKGHGIEPIIRDSRHFAICLLDAQDKLMARKFCTMSREADAFDSLPIETLISGAPIIKRSLLAIDCEVVRHFDLEADHELYIGRVLAARIYAPNMNL
ncbi:MAG: flavin reductase family protein [Phycisphaerales bacterium]|nr:flavin reductase family protein [Phycisphaerales bacterium]